MEYTYTFASAFIHYSGIHPLNSNVKRQGFTIYKLPEPVRYLYHTKHKYDNRAHHPVYILVSGRKNSLGSAFNFGSPAYAWGVGIKFVNISDGQKTSINLL